MEQRRPYFDLFRASLALAALFIGACAERKLPPVSMGIDLQKYNVIAIRSVPYERGAAPFDPPVKGAGAGTAQGAGEGTLGWIGGCALGSAGILLPICLVLTPVATVTGAIAGAGASHSAKEVTSATTALKNALNEAAPAEALKQAVVRKIRETRRARYEVRALSESEASLSYAELSKLGFDAVLDVRVSHLDLAVIGRIDPAAKVIVAVHGSVYDTAAQSASLPLSWTYHSDRHGYFDLAKDNARLLNQLLEQAYDKIATLIVNDLHTDLSLN